ncbi:hypothetical protein B4Q13_19550, partial [Lacticaseibacillus rhamnosus]
RQPITNVCHHDPAIDRDVAAIFDPFGNAVHSALQFPVLGEDVLITGAGPIGIMAVAIARFVGARHIVITDVNDYRLGLARQMGASRAINVARDSLDQTMKDLDMQEGFDVGLEIAFTELGNWDHHVNEGSVTGQIATRLDEFTRGLAALAADLSISVEARNLSDQTVSGTIRGRINPWGRAFERPVTLAPHGTTPGRVTPDSVPVGDLMSANPVTVKQD